MQKLLKENESSVNKNLPELETKGRHLNTNYPSSDLLKMYGSLEKKHTDVSKHLQDGVQTWGTNAACHDDFDQQVTQCLQQIGHAEQADEEICRDAYKLQSQLLLETKVKVWCG